MKRFLSILLLNTLALAIANGGTPTTIPRLRPATPRPAPDGHRFLFVVDVSSAMRGTEAANRQALFDLIFTGLDGQMRTGDSFGLWLFNDELHARDFPMQVWEDQRPMDTASLAAKFLRQQKYSGKSRPDVMMPRLLSLIRGVRDLNVIILSDGASALEGTPFDANIAAAYERRRSERSKAQKPFATALVARGGAIVSGAVVIAGEYVALPERPAPTVASKGTNNAASPTKAAPTPGVAASIPPAIPPALQETGEPQITVSLTPQPALPPPPRVFQIVTRSNSTPKNPGVAEGVSTNVQSATTPPPAPGPAPVPEPSPGPPPPSPEPPPSTAVATTPPETLPLAPMPVAAREISPPIPADARPISATAPGVQALATPPVEPAGVLLLAIGGVLLAACLALLALVLRRPRPLAQGSIITRSMGGR